MYLHARYFDPELGTFLSPDPSGVEGGLNQYGYALGDSINLADPSGLNPHCWPGPEPGMTLCLGTGGGGGGSTGSGGNAVPRSGSPGAPAGGTSGGSFYAGICIGGGCNGPFYAGVSGRLGDLWSAFKTFFGGLFGGHSNNAPRDPSVPPSTAYVSGKHIDPYSDYEEPGEDSLVSLVPTAGVPTTGVEPPPLPPPPPGGGGGGGTLPRSGPRQASPPEVLQPTLFDPPPRSYAECVEASTLSNAFTLSAHSANAGAYYLVGPTGRSGFQESSPIRQVGSTRQR